MKNKNKILLIIGSAPCVVDDISWALSLKQSIYRLQATSPSCDIMLIGLDSVDKCLLHAKYFATYHPYEIMTSAQRRINAGGNTDWTIISHEQHEGLVNIIIPLAGVPSGSSALLGVHAGMQEGYEKIILCGCPLTGKNSKGSDYNKIFARGWKVKLSEIKDAVRSMSGWTQELLGAPTQEWLSSIVIPRLDRGIQEERNS